MILLLTHDRKGMVSAEDGGSTRHCSRRRWSRRLYAADSRHHGQTPPLLLQRQRSARKLVPLIRRNKSLFTLIADLAAEEEEQHHLCSSSPSSLLRGQSLPRSAAVERATGLCQQAATQITTVLKSLQDGLQKKRVRQTVAAVKFAFQEKQIMRGLQKLERAKPLLSLAQQHLLQ